MLNFLSKKFSQIIFEIHRYSNMPPIFPHKITRVKFPHLFKENLYSEDDMVVCIEEEVIYVTDLFPAEPP